MRSPARRFNSWIGSVTCPPSPTGPQETRPTAGRVELMTIPGLMSQLDHLALAVEPNLGRHPNWLPESAEGKAVFRQLTATRIGRLYDSGTGGSRASP